jgi:hypothetical protein
VKQLSDLCRFQFRFERGTLKSANRTADFQQLPRGCKPVCGCTCLLLYVGSLNIALCPSFSNHSGSENFPVPFFMRQDEVETQHFCLCCSWSRTLTIRLARWPHYTTRNVMTLDCVASRMRRKLIVCLMTVKSDSSERNTARMKLTCFQYSPHSVLCFLLRMGHTATWQCMCSMTWPRHGT